MCQRDSQYVEQCLNGHPEAYRHLVRRYHDVLVSDLAGRLGGLEQAEDIAQEAFIRGFFSLGGLQKPESFFPWLVGIANRVLREERRAAQRHRSVVQGWFERASAMVRPKNVHSKNHGLERAIAQLPDIYRQVIVLRYYGGRTCAQIAEELQIAPGTVTSRLSRAYRILRRLLDQQDAVGSTEYVQADSRV